MMRQVLDTAAFFRGMPTRITFMVVMAFREYVFSPGDLIIRRGEIYGGEACSQASIALYWAPFGQLDCNASARGAGPTLRCSARPAQGKGI